MTDAGFFAKTIRKRYFRLVAFILALGVFALGSLPREGLAYVVEANGPLNTASRKADMGRVQRVLEEKLVQERLQSLGLSTNEARTRLDKLADEELHSFAKNLDSIYPGGDVTSVLIILLIVLLVMVLLKLEGKRIIIK